MTRIRFFVLILGLFGFFGLWLYGFVPELDHAEAAFAHAPMMTGCRGVMVLQVASCHIGGRLRWLTIDRRFT
jgi:hypothetical protein